MSLIDRRSAPLPGSVRSACRVKDILRHAVPLDHPDAAIARRYLDSLGLLPLSPLLLYGRVLFRPHLDYVARLGAGSYPALIGRFSTYVDESRSVECTFLREDGSAIADLKPPHSPRLYFGLAGGYFLPLSHGQTGRPLSEARRPEHIIITQRLETGLKIIRDMPEARVWVGISLRNIGGLPLEMPQIGRLTFVFDELPLADHTGSLRALIARKGKPVQMTSGETFLRGVTAKSFEAA